mmetsp:Transcript_732/g.1207  ORF Transcript_732/g.1207 Transcript_732/m.1207 type:complete len:961 (-) Transcript_732:44-2926(-)
MHAPISPSSPSPSTLPNHPTTSSSPPFPQEENVPVDWKKLYNGFKILRGKYDNLKTDVAFTMWDYIPKKVEGFDEIGQANNSIFESSKRIGDYRIGELLGEGQFGDVKLAVKRDSEKTLAVKIMRKDRIHSVKGLKRVQNEIAVLKKVRHSNIVCFVDVIFSPNYVYLFVEKWGMDLFEFFSAHLEGLDHKTAAENILGITLPIAYLHSMNICHRDLKPENVLLKMGEGGKVECGMIQICDFGLCQDVGPDGSLLSEFCGSPGFFAPEMILEGGIYDGLLVDIWSIGCIMLELTLGHDKFCKKWMSAYDFEIIQRPSSFEDSIEDAVADLDLEGMTKEMKDFITDILVIKPSSRCSSEALLSSSWFEGHPSLPKKLAQRAANVQEGNFASPIPTPSRTRAMPSSSINIGQDATMVVMILLSNLSLGMGRTVPNSLPKCNSSLANISKQDCQTLANVLLYYLKNEVNEEDAVEKFINNYDSMRELNTIYGQDFKESLLNCCKGLHGDKQIFAKIKLFVAAFLSVFDMLTDILMCFEYFARDQDGFAWATVGSIALNIFLQSLFTFLQNKARPTRQQLREQLHVLTLIKPGVDAWRVASGSEQEEGAVMHTMAEFTGNKVIELIAEAIPGSVIQLTALLKFGLDSPSANFSFLFCIFTAAFSSAMLSFDWDTNKSYRKSTPWFYGYIPSSLKERIVVFMSLLYLSAFNLFARSLACVLLHIKGGFTCVALMLGLELLLYLIVKLLQRDFVYWMPVYGVWMLISSLTIRSIVKVVTDWTSVVQFRHPNEVGAFYFSFSLVSTVVMSIVAALSYEEPSLETEEEEDVDVSPLEYKAVVVMSIGACIGVVLSYILLLCYMNPDYLQTFISPKTSCTHTCNQFTQNDEDEEKFWIFASNRHKWEKRIGEKVKKWLNDSLPIWLDDEPSWFNNAKLSTIPDDMVEDKELLERLKNKNTEISVLRRRA